MTTPPPHPQRLPLTDGPFLVGDRVRGTTYVPPALRKREASEPVEGVVVQVGSGYENADAEDGDLLWVRIADCTERQCRVGDVVTAGVETEPLCDICKVGRAPFLRYGTLENTGRMCSACLHRTRLCAICQQPTSTAMVALPTVDQGTGPGWTSYACLDCTERKGMGT
ncbi:hypothetical protein PV396_39755 [Streptomyces sp. ME02-8801-2C]|uniref:hypothetical protein n=1 Tax=Streptomyces sp. ME02-8801-2C TaxID=3028680 RepID=UPI0029B94F77|nr:hypothetical protein [Streptomyces sp. ME02-8801-2C]MDX3458014.1 hypothetical protein [Streptomyces sp. ME02-8801-2C]